MRPAYRAARRQRLLLGQARPVLQGPQEQREPQVRPVLRGQPARQVPLVLQEPQVPRERLGLFLPLSILIRAAPAVIC